MLGTGTSTNPFVIQNPTDLNTMRNYLNNTTIYFTLGNDIDMSSWGNFAPIGTTGTNNRFKGHLDGKGFKIKNLTVSNFSTGYAGLFGMIDNTASIIKNIGIENCSINSNGSSWVGAIAGTLINGTIENCYSTGKVDGRYMIGGIVGQLTGGTVKNCWSSANTTGYGRVGGLVGYIGSTGKVENSYSTGKPIATEVGTPYPAGGLVGDNIYTNYSNVVRSYWDTQTSGVSISTGGTGRTTQQMKTQSTYGGWDFTNTWAMIDNSYPFLTLFGIPNLPKVITVILVSTMNSINTKISRSSKILKQVKSFVSNAETKVSKKLKTKVVSYVDKIQVTTTKTKRMFKNVLNYSKEIETNRNISKKKFKTVLSNSKEFETNVQSFRRKFAQVINYVSKIETKIKIKTIGKMVIRLVSTVVPITTTLNHFKKKQTEVETNVQKIHTDLEKSKLKRINLKTHNKQIKTNVHTFKKKLVEKIAYIQPIHTNVFRRKLVEILTHVKEITTDLTHFKKKHTEVKSVTQPIQAKVSRIGKVVKAIKSWSGEVVSSVLTIANLFIPKHVKVISKFKIHQSKMEIKQHDSDLKQVLHKTTIDINEHDTESNIKYHSTTTKYKNGGGN